MEVEGVRGSGGGGGEVVCVCECVERLHTYSQMGGPPLHPSNGGSKHMTYMWEGGEGEAV